MWSIPLMVILLLGGVAWIGSHDLDPAKPIASESTALEIEVVSLDWKWLFIYPEQGVASVNRLVVPAGRPLHFSLTSASVWNSFFVPQLGSQIYAMNGMATQLYLHADTPGRYDGISAHYSGDGFSDMRFTVDAVEPERFTAWVAETRADACVVEVGLGGRLDATNVIARPLVTGIAQLGLDHQAFLGDRLEDIAAEKAGIAKRGVPLITQGYPATLADRIGETAAKT